MAQVMVDDIATKAARRLELVQALRLPTTTPARKIEVASELVDSLKVHGENDPGGASNPTSGWMKTPQVVGFLSEWVQSVLIRSCKPGVTCQPRDTSEVPPHLDTRYWSIMSFCLLSGYLHPFSSVSPTLMRPLTSCVSSPLTEPFIAELIEVVDVLFTKYDRPFRSNLDGWVSLAASALSLLSLDGREISLEDSTLTTLVSIVLEGFSRTVSSHSNPTKVFQAIIARLIEPLLLLIGDSTSTGNNTPLQNRLAHAAEEILANGLFHSAHVGGFSEVCVFLKGRTRNDLQAKGKMDSECRQRSYHRMFFQKLDDLRNVGNYLVLTGLGRIFKMYSQKLKAQQASLSEDIYGVRGQGKLQPGENNTGEKVEVGGSAKVNEQSGQEKEIDKNEESTASHLKKQASGTDALFTVLAELLGPLKLELEHLTGSEEPQMDINLTVEAHRIQKISSLMRAVNELLIAAKEANAYKPLEDTPGLKYFNFLQDLLNLTVKVGGIAFDIWSIMDTKTPILKKKKSLSRVNTRIDTSIEVAVISREAIFSYHHLLKLEYRVFEQQLPQLWLIVFKMIASNVHSKITILEALEFSQCLLNMYSDLRQVDIPIFHLTDSLTSLLASAQLDVLSSAVENIVCAKPFLATLGLVIHKAPEGQGIHLFRKLTAAVAITLDAVQSNENSPFTWKILESSMKGLLEVFTCILENANVTSSNSVLVGGAVKELLMKVLAPPMTLLVDACTETEDVTEKEFLLRAWKALFLLMLYSASRSLHRQCLLLMPPKAAKKASASVAEPNIDLLTANESDQISYLKENGFLMSLQRGSVKVSKLLTKLVQKIGPGRLRDVPALSYQMSRISLQSLVDVDRNVLATNFLSMKANSTKFSKCLRSLHREGANLVALMLDGLDSIGLRAEYDGSLKWDGVVATLDSDTVSLARWFLVCETTDVWSKYASEDVLKDFVVALLRSGRACHLKRNIPDYMTCSGEESDPTSVTENNFMDLEGITQDLLRNVDFFENEAIRKVFAHAFLLELKNLLLPIYTKDSTVFSLIDQCIESTVSVSTATSKAGFVEKVKSMLRVFKHSHCNLISRDLCWTEDQVKTFHHFIGLLKLFASLPGGYLPSADIARCAYTICGVEKLLVDTLHDKNQAAQYTKKLSSQKNAARVLSAPSHLLLAYGLIACRSALEFLTDSLTTLESNIKDSELISMFFGSSTSTQSLTLVPGTVTSCLLNDSSISGLRSSHQSDSCTHEGTSYGISRVHAERENIFYTILKGTCAIVEASLGNVCSSEAKLLVCPKPSPDEPTPEYNSGKKKSKKLKGPLSTFYRVLVTEAQNVEVFLKNEHTSSEWQSPFTAVAVINSVLWSMTKALETVDEECRRSKSSPLIWRTELPDSWLSVIMELEPVLVHILLCILFPTDTTELSFFTQAGTQSLKVEDFMDVDALEEDNGEIQEVVDEDVEASSDEDSPDEDEATEDGVTNEEQETDALHQEHNSPLLVTSLGNVIGGSSSSQFSSLHSILKEKVREKSMFVGELYMALAAVVKLRALFSSPFAFTSPIPASPFHSNVKDGAPPSMNVLLLGAYWLLSGSVGLIQRHQISNSGWLRGVVQYMASVGAYLPCMKPFILPLDFMKLINLHLELLGAIGDSRKSLTETSDNLDDMKRDLYTADWKLNIHDFGASETRSTRSDWSEHLEFAVQRSFESLLKYAPRQHMVLALQSVEKAVAGVWEGSNRGSGLECSSTQGCQVGAVVAAGVNCLGLSLQAVSGKMRLSLLASRCPAFFGGLFNLLGHLQGPSLFFERHRSLDSGSDKQNRVNAAPVVLLSVEILTTLTARAVIFPMKASIVALALQCPAMLFRPFIEFGKPKSVLLRSALLMDEFQDSKMLTKGSPSQILDEASLNLYVACCRLLCALLRYRLQECGHSMALLGDSCRILLQCLTAPSWTEFSAPVVSATARTAKCASWLGRVYEEMEKHKGTMGKYCSHLLADYLNVISGHSFGSIGLKREVDTALRPGAFALLNACSSNDLQQLHATLGEGSRRSALMTLRSDFDLHFKYTGKV